MNRGEKAPGFDLPGVDGKNVRLSDFAGNVVAVIFTCNHCPYAKAYQDRIKKIQAKYPQVRVVAINANDDEGYPEDSFENMKARARQAGFNFPYLRDETQETARAYGAQVTPDVFLLDKNHKLVYRGRVDDHWQEEDHVREKSLENAIQDILAGKPVSNPEARAIGCSIKWKSA
ncbi:thioredoxin family protein [Candidatus Micrarchaeota archaeon]|nr:thioredoxin family protein [Candidatus Micrarchaeota archaeon]